MPSSRKVAWAQSTTPDDVAPTWPDDPADGDRFAGDDAGGDMPLHHRDGVHDPGHDPGVGVHVRSWDVTVGAEQRRDVEGVPPREPLQLPFRQRGRVDDNPALRAAERDVDDGALDRHVRGERHHLAHVDRGVEPDPALAGPTRRAVLHPPTGEDLDAPVIAPDRDRDLENPFRRDDDLGDPVFESQQVRCILDPSANGVPGIPTLVGHAVTSSDCHSCERTAGAATRRTRRLAPRTMIADPTASRPRGSTR